MKCVVRFIQYLSHFLVCCLCVWVFFAYENLCVDTVNLTVPMDLSGIPWIFIYLLFMRGSLTSYITRPHFLWLHLWHVKAHGDLGATSLSYFLENKRTQCCIYTIFQFFSCILTVCLCFVCLQKSMCWQSVSHNTHGSEIPWLFIYLLFLRGSLIYCTARPHLLWLRLWHIKAHGDLGAPNLSYFKKMNSTHKWDVMECWYTLYSFWGKPSLESLVWRSLYVCYIHDLVFIWQCRVFETMNMTHIIEVDTAALARTWVVRYLKKMIYLDYI